MNTVDIIIKKRDGLVLTKEEIEYIINEYANDNIPDYQMSAFLMAIYFRGMTDEETYYMTMAMLHTGKVIDLSRIKGFKVDKHSTGGVGDKTSLVLAPLVASLGIKFAKMSGRGLGHTGGTLDKLESIAGFNISMSIEDFIDQVEHINIAIIGQTEEIDKADKKMYALRDVTGTVPSIPLIASSIMSKKLAAGSDAIILDVKVGSGAFMNNIADAKTLATLMKNIGTMAGKKMTCVLTNMDEPLGFAVGNALEVIEAIDTLNGRGPRDLTELCLTLGSYLVVDAGLVSSLAEARVLLLDQIKSGKALAKLAELVEAQEGNVDYIYHPELFDLGEKVELRAECYGYVERIDSYQIGHASMLLGAGRETLASEIDYSVGIVIAKKVGDIVNRGDLLATIYTSGKNTEQAYAMLKGAFKFSEDPVDAKLILDVVR